MTEEDLLEHMAEQMHNQWSAWTEHMLECLHPLEIRTPETAAVVERWRRQIRTHYCDLSEEEKESDREWARLAIERTIPYMQFQMLKATAQSHQVAVDLAKSQPPAVIVKEYSFRKKPFTPKVKIVDESDDRVGWTGIVDHVDYIDRKEHWLVRFDHPGESKLSHQVLWYRPEQLEVIG